jgi:hypothetical protein
MRLNEAPPGYTTIFHAIHLNRSIDYCLDLGGLDQEVVATVKADGVSVKPMPACRISAIVELDQQPPPTPGAFRLSPAPTTQAINKNWRVGFTQNMVEGELIYLYESKTGKSLIAAMGPRILPCKDSGSPDGTWYDPSPFSHKGFGDEDTIIAMQDAAPPPPHRCHSDPNVRYIVTEDAPGSGATPIRLNCVAPTEAPSVVGREYLMGFYNPLDPTKRGDDALRLTKILGFYTFKTWLGISPEPAKTTKNIRPLHRITWTVDYLVMVTVTGESGTAVASSQSRLIDHQPIGGLGAGSTGMILDAPDANDLASVRFRAKL